jgi:AraC family transcriptional regulator
MLHFPSWIDDRQIEMRGMPGKCLASGFVLRTAAIFSESGSKMIPGIFGLSKTFCVRAVCDQWTEPDDRQQTSNQPMTNSIANSTPVVWYESHRLQIIRSSSCLPWHGVHVVNFFTPGAPYEELVDRHSIVQIGSRPARAERCTQHGSCISFVKAPGSLTIAPAGTVPNVRLQTPSQLICCTLDIGFTRGIAEELDRQPSAAPIFQTGVQNKSIGKIIGLLSDELEAGGPSGTLYAETLAHALAIKFLQLNDTSEDRISSTKPLLPKILRRIQERIEAELNRQLSLHALAKESGYSRAHFLRMFRAATGLTPHQYVLERRLNRAQQLLKQKQTALADIAVACGFSSQTHMTDSFRNHLGITPGEYRRSF